MCAAQRTCSQGVFPPPLTTGIDPSMQWLKESDGLMDRLDLSGINIYIYILVLNFAMNTKREGKEDRERETAGGLIVA